MKIIIKLQLSLQRKIKISAMLPFCLVTVPLHRPSFLLLHSKHAHNTQYNWCHNSKSPMQHTCMSVMEQGHQSTTVLRTLLPAHD